MQPRWSLSYMGTKTFTLGFLAHKRAKFGPKYAFWAHIGLAGSFGALLVDWLVVVARVLYFATHLFIL